MFVAKCCMLCCYSNKICLGLLEIFHKFLFPMLTGSPPPPPLLFPHGFEISEMKLTVLLPMDAVESPALKVLKNSWNRICWVWV